MYFRTTMDLHDTGVYFLPTGTRVAPHTPAMMFTDTNLRTYRTVDGINVSLFKKEVRPETALEAVEELLNGDW